MFSRFSFPLEHLNLPDFPFQLVGQALITVCSFGIDPQKLKISPVNGSQVVGGQALKPACANIVESLEAFRRVLEGEEVPVPLTFAEKQKSWGELPGSDPLG